MGMEEKNEYFINNDSLDFILKKTNIHLSEEEKINVIDIINSDSVNERITNSNLDYSTQIIVLRIYLEWKKFVINNRFINKNQTDKPSKLKIISEKIKEIRN